MLKVYSIPENLVFSPCKVDTAFWTQFHTLISYLGNPDSLVELKEKDLEAYKAVIEPLIRFVSATEEELFDKGFLKEVDLEDNS